MNVKEMIQNPKWEHTLNWLKALAAWIPVVWWSINSLMSDYLPDYKYKKLEKFLKELSEKFENYTWENNEAYITSEEFGYLFEETMKKASIEYREEKLLAYKNFLYKSMIDSSIEDAKKEYFLWIIDRLNYYNLIILKIFYSTQAVITEFEIDVSRLESSWNSLSSVFTPLIQKYNIPQYLWENALKEVEQMWLLKDTLSWMNTTISRSNLHTLKESQSQFWKEFHWFIWE